MIQKIPATRLALKNTLLFSALLCLLSACWDDNASDDAAPRPVRGRSVSRCAERRRRRPGDGGVADGTFSAWGI